jgi:hypothetical protein
MLNFYKAESLARSLCVDYPRIRRFFCRSEPLVYIDALGNAAVSDETVLVLSPNDYWVLRVNLNVKSEKEAATYGAALFDLNDEYRYEALRVELNTYIVIAYNPHDLSERLNGYPDAEMIKKMTFAQWVFSDATAPIHLPNGKYLTSVDGIVIEIEASYIRTGTSVELKDALSAPRVFLKTLRMERLIPSLLTTKTLRNSLIILVILLGNLSLITVSSYQESLRLSEKIDTILTTSNLPSTSIEREAIFDSLKNKEKKQLRIRQISKEISDLPIEGKSITHPSLPSLPPVITPSSEGIVLIPGSKPDEPNRLIVDNTSSAPTISFHGEGIRAVEYDGNAINLTIDTRDINVRDSLKTKIMAHFKHAQINEHETQLEVRIK